MGVHYIFALSFAMYMFVAVPFSSVIILEGYIVEGISSLLVSTILLIVLGKLYWAPR